MPSNAKLIRPVISFRLDKETTSTFKALCIESDIEMTTAFEKLIKYFLQSSNIEVARIIISE